MPTDTEMLDYLIDHISILINVGPSKYPQNAHDTQWLRDVKREGIAKAMEYLPKGDR